MSAGRRLPALAALVAACAITTACAGGATAVPTTAGTESAGIPSSPVATPSGSAVPDAAAEPTCETIIPASTVADFRGLGWTAQQAPFVLGERQLAEGLQCTWGDFRVPSDHVQVFGWAPLADAEATAARSELLQNGWREVDEGTSIYITENATTAVAPDENGFGMTYQFGDGWVKVADTKQGLLLVEWPKS